MCTRFNSPRFLFILTLSSVLLITTLSFAQFSVVSSVPVNGTAGVDTAATFSITFSNTVDTSAHFPFPEDFFINLLLYPDSLIGSPDSITMSPDLKTVYIHNLHLAENTQYLFVVVNAVSQGGDSLDMPASLVFSTGSSLPTGQVSGTVSYPGNTPAGAMVGLFDANPFSEEESDPKVGIVVPAPDGNYTIDYVPAGTYWVVGIKDFYVDRWGEIEIRDGSALGSYDANNDLMPDSVTVSTGSQVSGIDISLSKVFSQTARDPFPMVEASAQSWASDAAAIGLGGDLDETGNSLFWQYGFYSPSLMEERTWIIAGNFMAITPTAWEENDTTALPLNWLNSDTVMTIAEAAGGSNFRQQYSDADSYGFLGYPDFTSKENAKRIETLPAIRLNIKRKISITHALPAGFNGAPVGQLPAVWYIDYYSDTSGHSLNIVIDAVTGEILNTPTTAAPAAQNALAAAQIWASDAKLWGVYGNWSSVDSDGTTQWWNCVYYSPSLDSLQMVAMQGQYPMFYGDPGWTAPDTLTLPDLWIDSDSAIAVAEAAGGATYRQTNDSVFVQAELTRWWYGPDPSKSVWKFIYYSTTAPDEEYLVDAVNGNLVSIGDDFQSGLVAHRLRLFPSYPNPFNPATQIRYHIPRASKVEIAVYNMLGQKISVLVNRKQTAGEHEVVWKPQGLASGPYLIRLQSGNQQAVRKVVYMK